MKFIDYVAFVILVSAAVLVGVTIAGIWFPGHIQFLVKVGTTAIVLIAAGAITLRICD